MINLEFPNGKSETIDEGDFQKLVSTKYKISDKNHIDDARKYFEITKAGSPLTRIIKKKYLMKQLNFDSILGVKTYVNAIVEVIPIIEICQTLSINSTEVKQKLENCLSKDFSNPISLLLPKITYDGCLVRLYKKSTQALWKDYQNKKYLPLLKNLYRKEIGLFLFEKARLEDVFKNPNFIKSDDINIDIFKETFFKKAVIYTAELETLEKIISTRNKNQFTPDSAIEICRCISSFYGNTQINLNQDPNSPVVINPLPSPNIGSYLTHYRLFYKNELGELSGTYLEKFKDDLALYTKTIKESLFLYDKEKTYKDPNFRRKIKTEGIHNVISSKKTMDNEYEYGQNDDQYDETDVSVEQSTDSENIPDININYPLDDLFFYKNLKHLSPAVIELSRDFLSNILYFLFNAQIYYINENELSNLNFFNKNSEHQVFVKTIFEFLYNGHTVSDDFYTTLKKYTTGVFLLELLQAFLRFIKSDKKEELGSLLIATFDNFLELHVKERTPLAQVEKLINDTVIGLAGIHHTRQETVLKIKFLIDKYKFLNLTFMTEMIESYLTFKSNNHINLDINLQISLLEELVSGESNSLIITNPIQYNNLKVSFILFKSELKEKLRIKISKDTQFSFLAKLEPLLNHLIPCLPIEYNPEDGVVTFKKLYDTMKQRIRN